MEARAKQASQFSPNSADNAEKTGPSEPKVDPKLQHTGEDFEQAGIGELGLERQRDLVRNQVDVPVVDKDVKPDTSDAIANLPADGVNTALESAGEPTMKITDPQNASNEPSVEEKLQLKKDASALIAHFKSIEALGQDIIDSMMKSALEKSASAPSQTPVHTKEQMLDAIDSVPAPTSDEVKTAMLPMVERALYAAELVALQYDQFCKESAANPPQPSDAGAAPKTPDVPAKQANIPPEMMDPAAAAAMQDPLGGGGGMPPEEAQMLLDQSLAENGVDPASLGGAPPEGMPPESVPMEGGGEGEADEAMILQALELTAQQLGISPEEVVEAIADMCAEEEAGIDPEMGAVADAEAEKTGQYKFASFIGRPRNKTAEQEQRAAQVRKVVRDIVYGPSTKDFN